MAKIVRFEDTDQEFEKLYSYSEEVSKLIRGFIKYLTPDSQLTTGD